MSLKVMALLWVALLAVLTAFFVVDNLLLAPRRESKRRLSNGEG